MKICIDLTSLADNFSGIERFALSITREIIKNQENRFILLFKNEVHESFTNKLSNVETIVIKGTNKLLFSQFILPINLAKINADFYLFLAFPAPFFFFEKNVINAIHDLSCWDCPESNKKHMLIYFRVMYWKASLNNKKIVTVSKFSKRRILDILKVKESNICVIYNGLSEQFTATSTDKSREEYVRNRYSLPPNYILCLSTLEPRKNIQLLVKAFSELYIENKEISLVLAGRKGWMMDKLLENLPESVKEKIYFTGFINDEDLATVYGLADCFVFPSLYEGFGIPPLEAMACGIPVISSDVTSMPEVLGDAAIYFINNDVESLKEKIKYVLTECNVNEIKQKEAIVVKRYKWDKEADKLLQFLNWVQYNE